MGVGGEAEKKPWREAELCSGQKRHHDGSPQGALVTPLCRHLDFFVKWDVPVERRDQKPARSQRRRKGR